MSECSYHIMVRVAFRIRIEFDIFTVLIHAGKLFYNIKNSLQTGIKSILIGNVMCALGLKKPLKKNCCLWFMFYIIYYSVCYFVFILL